MKKSKPNSSQLFKQFGAWVAYNSVMAAKEPMSGTPDPVVDAYKPGIDRTLIRENLRRSPEQRVRALQQLQAFAEELRRAGKGIPNRER
jgi:hypothetical protein